jgi:hypothetical protein
MRQKRVPVLLDMEFPPERELADVLAKIPNGEVAGFLRLLVTKGHLKIQRERNMATPGAATNEGGGHGH